MARVRQSRMTNVRRQTGVRVTERFQAHHDSNQEFIFNQQEQQIIISESQQTQIERIMYTNRSQAVKVMDRIFKKNIKKRLSTWKKAASDTQNL